MKTISTQRSQHDRNFRQDHSTRNNDGLPFMTSIGDDFPVQQARVREVLAQYLAMDGEPGVNVKPAIYMIEAYLAAADTAMASGDIVRILQAYKVLLVVQ